LTNYFFFLYQWDRRIIMKLECKSKMAQDLIKQLDERLSKINHLDYKGHPMEDSPMYAQHLENIKTISCMDLHGNTHRPFGTDMANRLLLDEIHFRREDECSRTK